MKKLIGCIAVIFGITSGSFAQTKPELPPDFFDKFSYSFPAGFNMNDSVQLASEVKNIATALDKMQQEAASSYRISDENALYFYLNDFVSLHTFFNRNKEAMETITKMRNLRQSPVYRAPLRLQDMAWSRTLATHAEDNSTAFRESLAASLAQEFNQTDAGFRDDIVNLQKANYDTSVAALYFSDVRDIVEQALQRNGGKLERGAAFMLLTSYENYIFLKKYQPVVEKVLYTFSPAKVSEINVKIPMRDGIKLNAFIYRNMSDSNRQPAIVSLSPYPSGGEAIKGNVFATNGYIYVYVDTRGRRESEGTFMPYEDDARDFYDIIDWVSKQSWCDGKVATSGGSYLGFDQWQSIRKQYKHPALKAINPMVAVGFGVDFPRNAGQFYPYILRWANFVSGKTLNQAMFYNTKFWNEKYYELYKKRLPFAKLDSVAGIPNPVFQKWVSHPDFDDYWQNILPSKEDYAALDIPVFTITGYYDADQGGALYYYNQHQKYGNPKALKDHILLIGPYEHGAAQWQPPAIQAGMELEKEAQIPIYKYVIWWFDWKLKNKAKPAFIKDDITYFETGSHTWKGTPSFKQLTTDSLELFLSPAMISNKKRKSLYSLSSVRSSQNASLKYRHDISHAIDSSFIYAQTKPFDDSLYMASPYNLVFESSPLKKDIVLSDKIFARIYATLNVPDADFEMQIDEVSPDGKSKTIGFGNVRARYRFGDQKGHLVKSGEVIEMNFSNIYVYIKRITGGSKLRIYFQSTNTPDAEKNFGFGGVVALESTTAPRIIEANILMNKKYPSKIVIPITTK